MSFLYGLLGVGLVLGYFVVETRGLVFSGTDTRPSSSVRSRSGSAGGGSGPIIWGSGFRGGK